MDEDEYEELLKRPTFSVKFLVGIPHANSRKDPIFVYPWEHEIDWQKISSNDASAGPVKHPIHKVREWQKRLSKDSSLTRAQIAREENLSRARVTQLFKLLELAPRVQRELYKIDDADGVRFFSVRKMLEIHKQSRRKQFDCYMDLWVKFVEKYNL